MIKKPIENEFENMEDVDKVYYKIYKSSSLNDKLTVVCMQWFDEFDYEEEHFFKDKNGETLKFFDELEAINWLLENIKEEFIDDSYLKLKERKNN